jgi:hypothetical protein
MAEKSLAGIGTGSMNRLCVDGLRWEFTSASLPAWARRRSDGRYPSGTDCSNRGGADLDRAHLESWERTMA